jgi:hypothetical protein
MNLRFSTAWQLNKLLYRLKLDDEFPSRLAAEMERYIAEYGLSDREAAALRTLDPAKILAAGGHPLFARYVLRLDPQYASSIYWTQV